MSTASRLTLISVEDYLAGELRATSKHEYVDGVVYAMAGALNVHNIIATNTLAALHARLRGQPCRPFNSGTKIRLRLPHQIRFYYPDLSVVCRPNPQNDSFQDEPVVLVEVLSESTRRVDEGEKRDAYLKLPSLAVYILLESESPAAIAWRRTPHGFVRETFDGQKAVVPLPEIGAELPLAEIYDGVGFSTVPVEPA